METKTAKRWVLAAGAVATLALSGAARGDVPSSGGPGALGTEVPYDSRLAREYFHYYLPTDTPAALHIRDEVQRLHAEHQAAIELGRIGARSQNPEVKALARRIGEDFDRADWTLVRVSNDSLIDLGGTAYDAEAQSLGAAAQEVQAAAEPEFDQAWASSVAKVLESALDRVEKLRPVAWDNRRQQLWSALDRERNLLRGQVKKARSLSSSLASRGPRGEQEG